MLRTSRLVAMDDLHLRRDMIDTGRADFTHGIRMKLK